MATKRIVVFWIALLSVVILNLASTRIGEMSATIWRMFR